MTLLSVAFCSFEITPWSKFIFEKLKVAVSGNSSPFFETRIFHNPVLKTSLSILMQMEIFLRQFQLQNSLKTPFNIILLVVLNSS